MPDQEAVAAAERELSGQVLSLLAEKMDAALAAAGRLAELRQRAMLSPQEVEEVYGLDAGSLRRMRAQGRGPRYFQENRLVMYRVADLNAWVEYNTKLTYDQQD